jgi:CubicO group peptidase (beta-lactamase class C family)
MRMCGPKTPLLSAISLLAMVVGLGFSGQSPLADDAARRIDEVFNEWNKPNTPGMSLAVVRNGQVAYARAFGMASLELEVANNPETVFDIGSISKQFTAAAVRILEYRGVLKLTDDIRAYIPEMPRYERPVMIQHLIHHTSGIRDYEVLQALAGEMTDQGWHTNRDLLGLIARQKGLNFPPGERFLYSNSGYTLLAVIIERVTGQSLGTFVKENIFKPLGMDRTFILEDNRVVVKNRARGYSLREGVVVLDETLNESTGDGGVQTTVLDFVRWDGNFDNNKLDLPDFVARMEEPGILADGRPAAMTGGSKPRVYASGLVLGTYRGLETVGHGGAYVGFRAGYLRFPRQRVSIILMANIADINPVAYCERVADIVLENEFKEPAGSGLTPGVPAASSVAPSSSRPADDLGVYAGEYFSEELAVAYALKVQDGRLCFVRGNAPSPEPLRPEGDDVFRFGRTQIKFRRGHRGRILGFTVESAQANGLSFRKVR